MVTPIPLLGSWKITRRDFDLVLAALELSDEHHSILDLSTEIVFEYPSSLHWSISLVGGVLIYQSYICMTKVKVLHIYNWQKVKV